MNPDSEITTEVHEAVASDGTSIFVAFATHPDGHTHVRASTDATTAIAGAVDAVIAEAAGRPQLRAFVQ